jgi:hypothetical protein
MVRIDPENPNPSDTITFTLGDWRRIRARVAGWIPHPADHWIADGLLRDLLDLITQHELLYDAPDDAIVRFRPNTYPDMAAICLAASQETIPRLEVTTDVCAYCGGLGVVHVRWTPVAIGDPR